MKPHDKNTIRSVFIYQLAGYVSAILYIVAVIQMLMTFYYPVGSNSDPLEVYIRNFSTILMTGLLAQFIFDYRIIHLPINDEIILKTAKQLSIISIILVIACICKVIVSAVFMGKYLMNGNMVAFYYAGELLAWLAVGIFAYTYYKRL